METTNTHQHVRCEYVDEETSSMQTPFHIARICTRFRLKEKKYALLSQPNLRDSGKEANEIHPARPTLVDLFHVVSPFLKLVEASLTLGACKH